MREIGKLNARKVATITTRGRYGDGGGLWLQVTPSGTKSWLFRYSVAGRERWMGIGAIHTFSLLEARNRARDARQAVANGFDPINAKREARTAARIESAKQKTFGQCVEEFLTDHGAKWKNRKHRDQWESTLKNDAALLWNLSINSIDTNLVLQVLRPIWKIKQETASRLRARIERVLAWATVSEYRRGENPARWTGHLKEMLPTRPRREIQKHHPALDYFKAHEVIQALRAKTSMSARALEFTILTAARTSETINARWREFDFTNNVWIVPAERMKNGREHRIPLCRRVIEILSELPREYDSDDNFVFPGSAGKPLSNMAMAELLKGMAFMSTVPGRLATVHGFRSTFRDWCKEQTSYSREIAELALAHVIQDRSEAAYSRGDALEKRRALMRDWAHHCETSQACRSKVTPIRSAAGQ